MKKVRITVLLVVLLLPLCGALGQSLVSEVQNTDSDTSIVRYWNSSISVVYSHREGDLGWFLLVDSLSPEVQRVPVPDNVTVNDFRILNDTVFVGGHYVDGGGTLHGLLACFAIQDFYNGAGNYRWAAAMWSPMPDCLYGLEPSLSNCMNMIYDITRLVVYDSGGYSKIAYIAKNHVNSVSDTRVGIGCARYNGVSWEGLFLYNKYAIEEYTDIIATQNYVVAVARTNDSARLALRIYPKNGFLYPIGPYPIDVFYPNKFGQGLADLEVDENVMATALDYDQFAVAFHYKKLPEEGLAVRTFDIVGGLATLLQGLNSTVVRQPGSVWKMRDVCYSPLLKRLMVLNDFDGGTVGGQTSIIYHFSLPTLTTGAYQGEYLKGYDLHDMASFESTEKAFVASGKYLMGIPLSLFRESLVTNASCGMPDVINCNATSPSLYTTFMQTNLNQPVPIVGSTPFVVENVEKDVICNR